MCLEETKEAKCAGTSSWMSRISQAISERQSAGITIRTSAVFLADFLVLLTRLWKVS